MRASSPCLTNHRAITMRKSVPFSVGILTLMTLVVVPLAAALLWLGWHASDTLEQDNINLRMAALDDAVTSWVSGQLGGIAWVGQTLAEAPSFSAASSSAVDEERFRQLIAVLGRHRSIAAAYAGYADGRFVYAGRTSILSPEMRAELGASNSDNLIVRTIAGADGNRRESWHFVAPEGAPTPERSRPSAFDPRTRPWYREAMAAHTATMTEPYRFAQSGTQGVSVATPIRDGAGALGFNVALSMLSRVVAQYKPSAGSIVMVMTGAGNRDRQFDRLPTGRSRVRACRRRRTRHAPTRTDGCSWKS